MSRLYDRVLERGCAPITFRHVLEASYAPDERRELLTASLGESLGRDPTDQEVEDLLRRAMQGAAGKASSDEYGPGDLEDAVVISAEEVADYWASLPEGTDVVDLLDVVVPPFDDVFIEFQNRPNKLGLRSWGLLLGTGKRGRLTDEDGLVAVLGEDGEEELRLPGGELWILGASLIGEWTKGRPIGPIARWLVRLDSDGRPMREGLASGTSTLFALPLEIPDYEERDAYAFTNSLGPSFLGPALFAISLMHCKNVDVRPVEPPERLSRSHQRRHGRPLTRYHVLDIQPMRRILDREGEAQSRGLRHALHICRGHFKTYTPEAPLLGRHTGTYWWPAHVRGAADEGVVDKDYRIRLDEGLGREYVEADEHPEIQPTAPEHTGRDPDLGGRGLRAHNATQNMLAAVVREAGHDPRRPKPDEPQYDLAWEANDVTWVAEIKSITPQNEERQLRTALGQVLRYRQLLEADGRTVRAMIAAEVRPSDPSWIDLCSGQNVALVWAPENLKVE